MTSTPSPLDDDLLSSVLDGDADAATVARIAADPSASSRLSQLHDAQGMLAASSVPPLGDDVITAMIDSAVQTTSEHDDQEPDRDGVVPIPSSRTGPVPGWLVAAVVLILMGIGLTLVYTGRDQAEVAFNAVGSSIGTSDDGSGDLADRGEASAVAPDAAAPAESEAAGAEATTTASAGSETSDDVPVLVPLGDFTDSDALRVHLRDGFPQPDESTPPSSEADLDAAFRCLGKVDAMFNTDGDPVNVGLATVAGDRTVVYELPYETDDGTATTLVLAVGELSCIPVLGFQR
jgi:hypothetical protein